MILYVDTSSIVSVHLLEPGRHQRILELLDEAEAVATSRVSYVEARAAFELARREPVPQPRLSPSGYAEAVRALDADWRFYLRISITERLVKQAGDLADKHSLKGYDAVQLSSALTLQRRAPEEIMFSTWDIALSKAATAEGLSLAHEVTT